MYEDIVNAIRGVADLPPLVCGGCTLCCKRTIVPIIPEEDPDPATYQTDELNGLYVLAHKSNGDCVYLGDDGCTIYDRRPVVCSLYDCRGDARQYNMKGWKVIAKKLPHRVNLDVIRQGKRLLAAARRGVP